MRSNFLKIITPAILLALFFAVASLSGCKTTTEDPTVPQTGIVGKWRWTETWFMIPISETNPQTPQNTGIKQTLEFRKDSIWLKTKNNVLVDSGTYTLGHGSITFADAFTYVYDSIAYYKNNINIKNDYYEIDSNNNLIFSGAFKGCAGCGSEHWARIK